MRWNKKILAMKQRPFRRSFLALALILFSSLVIEASQARDFLAPVTSCVNIIRYIFFTSLERGPVSDGQLRGRREKIEQLSAEMMHLQKEASRFSALGMSGTSRIKRVFQFRQSRKKLDSLARRMIRENRFLAKNGQSYPLIKMWPRFYGEEYNLASLPSRKNVLAGFIHRFGPETLKSFLVEIRADGRFYYVKTGELVDTLHSSFVMNELGDIYIAPFSFRYIFGEGAGAHSSFFGGRPLSACGLVRIELGILQVVTDECGHYVPPKESLDYFLKEIEKRQADISGGFVKRYIGIGRRN